MQDSLQDEIDTRTSDIDFQGLKVSLKDTLEYSSVPNRRAVRNKRAGGKIL